MAANFRPLVHVSSLLVPVFAEVISKPLTIVALCIVAAIYVSEELLRLKGRSLPLILSFTLRMSRPNERSHFIARPLYLALGVVLVLILLPRNVAYASIAIVAVGDPVAAYIGTRFGRMHVGSKSLEGFVAGTCASFAAALFLVSPVIAATGSIIGMLLELSGFLDDNLTIPVGSGIMMMLATTIIARVVI